MKSNMSHPTYILYSFLTITIIVSICLSVKAQSAGQYDRGTPPQNAAGVPSLDSYTSAEIGTVNLSNGGLTFSLPLGSVGGGDLGFPLTLDYNSKIWSTMRSTEVDPQGRDRSMLFVVSGVDSRTMNSFNRITDGWTFGGIPMLVARGVPMSFIQYPGSSSGFAYRLVKLSLILPGRGEIELRDDLTDGSPFGAVSPSTIGYQDGDRGRRWHASDGSGAIFISDNDNGVAMGDVAGVVVTADGTRYRFVNVNYPGGYQPVTSISNLARCISITDRNGNTAQISYPSDTEVNYTDRLGRVTKVQKNVPDPADPATTLALLVTLNGYQGQPRYYKVKTGTINQNFRSGINPVLPVITGNNDRYGYCYHGNPPAGTVLFGSSYCRRSSRIDTKLAVTELVLPDGRSLRFAYNEYAEVAEAQLPTGGKIQYDYDVATSLPVGPSAYWETHAQVNDITGIDRAVVARRNYPDGTTLKGSWNYIYGPQTVNGVTYACTEVKCAVDGAPLLDQLHFFLAAGRYVNGDIIGGTDDTGYTLWSTGIEWRTETRDSFGNIIAAIEQNWSQRVPVAWSNTNFTQNPVFGQQQPQYDNRVSERRIYIDTGAFSKIDILYDNTNNVRANNVTETWEYDFDQTLKRRTVTSYLTTNPDNGSINYSADDIFLLRLPTQQSVYEGDIEKARTVYQYDKYLSDGNNAGLTDYGLPVTGHDAAYGPGKTTRGNVTAAGRWLNTDGSTLFAYSRYDTLGNVISIKNPRGNVTTISYADNFGVGDDPESGAGGAFGPTFALPTLITSPPSNPGEQQHTLRNQYDFNTGLLTGFKDRNGVITKTEYNDSFNRLTKIIDAKGVTGVETQTAMYYAPQSTPYGITLARNDVLTAKDRDTAGDGVLRSWAVTDGFGRTIESWTRHPQGDVKATTVYDALGRVIQTSNPYRNGETPVYTTTTYDLAGRVTAVVTPGSVAVSTAYNGNQVTVTDQAGKKRRSETDALGRSIKVIEDPGGLNYETYYSYDALDNLRQVNQGSQTRTFVYDSLSRLISATNPESGTMTYVYDPSDNLIERMDARGVKTMITYDALNRVRSKVYVGTTPEGTAAANATPPVKYSYDDYSTLPSGAPSWPGTPSKGRLIGVTYGPGSEGTYYKYDTLGRIVTSQQRTGTSNYATAYFYNRAGAVTREERGIPARRRALMSYDVAGRLATMDTGSYPFSAYVPLVHNISYTPFGGLQSETYGNGLIHSMSYNERLQPAEIRLGRQDNLESVFRLGYIFGTAYNVNGQDYEITLANNNNNVARIKYFISGTLQYSQTFQYDPLNRLRYAVEHNNGTYSDSARAWYQTFDYDRYGNRGINVADTSGNAANSALQLADFSEANNRIARAGFIYDACGNLIAEPGKSYAYDAENRIITATVAGRATSQYVYDGNGLRVKKIVSGVATRFEYGAGSELIAERNDSTSNVIKDYFYKNGELLATTKPGASGEFEYATADHLGTPRAWTDNSGNLVAGGRHDYLAFGEELFAGYGVRTTDLGYAATTQAGGQRNQFTSKERDSESGLDYFYARYYSSVSGRFISADPYDPVIGGGNVGLYSVQPQNWNKYAYAYNNSLKYVDSDGENPILSAAIGFVIGGVAGGGIELAKEAYISYRDNGNFSGIKGKAVLGKSLRGAVFGAVVGFTANPAAAAAASASASAAITTLGIATGTTSTAAIGGAVGTTFALAGAGVAGGAIDRAITGSDPLSPPDIVVDALAGAVGGALGRGVYLTTYASNAQREFALNAAISFGERALPTTYQQLSSQVPSSITVSARAYAYEKVVNSYPSLVAFPYRTVARAGITDLGNLILRRYRDIPCPQCPLPEVRPLSEDTTRK
jgi:RHS repeat-associated protein